MSKIIMLNQDSITELELVRKSLMSLRKCYPGFLDWYNKSVLPFVNTERKVFLATNKGDFTGAMILKNTESEKKVCTLFTTVKGQHLGLDLLRIASEELETYKLPITISDEAKDYFFNNEYFNFYTKNIEPDKYTKGVKEYIGYLMFRNPDSFLKRI